MVMNYAEQKTAKIYTFPVQRRMNAAAMRARLEAEARQYPATDFGSGWYHDDAIARANKPGRS
jgi:hypothetical protein